MSQKSIQNKLTELREIVESFDDEELDVAKALEQFEAGEKLARDIEKDLSELKTRVTVLKEKFDS